ncbi:hypothetical protein JCM3263A_21800 [Thermobifida fusca]
MLREECGEWCGPGRAEACPVRPGPLSTDRHIGIRRGVDDRGIGEDPRSPTPRLPSPQADTTHREKSNLRHIVVDCGPPINPCLARVFLADRGTRTETVTLRDAE